MMHKKIDIGMLLHAYKRIEQKRALILSNVQTRIRSTRN